MPIVTSLKIINVFMNRLVYANCKSNKNQLHFHKMMFLIYDEDFIHEVHIYSCPIVVITKLIFQLFTLLNTIVQTRYNF